jgi:hypothetical protein
VKDFIDDELDAELIPQAIRNLYQVINWKHAAAIMKTDFPSEWNDIMEVLKGFRIFESDVAVPGGRKSKLAERLDQDFYKRGWVEKGFNTRLLIDEQVFENPTHKIDCYKNRVALETEWNNKDPFYDRDLNNFRILFELRAISVGVILTRCDELQDIFEKLGRGDSYGNSTTHMGKLIPRIKGDGGGGCPVLVFGMRKALYVGGPKK